MLSKNINFSLRILTLIIIIGGCKNKAFPDKHFRIEPTFLDLLNSFISKDTLLFETYRNGVDTFVLTRIDSSINNRKGYFMNARAFKSVYVCYKQVPINYWTNSRIEHAGTNREKKITEENKLISVTKYPDKNLNELYISFKNFHCNIQSSLGVLHKDSLKVNNISFTDYYCLESTAKSLVRNATDIEVIYVTIKDGLIAYREKSGRIRARINQ